MENLTYYELENDGFNIKYSLVSMGPIAYICTSQEFKERIEKALDQIAVKGKGE